MQKLFLVGIFSTFTFVAHAQLLTRDSVYTGGVTFTAVEQMPTFPGGDDSLKHFLQQHIIYPESAISLQLEGKVYISFVIEVDGSVKNVKLLRGIKGAPELGQEALRVAAAMPLWNAGMQDGKPIAVQLNLPIVFTLPKK